MVLVGASVIAATTARKNFVRTFRARGLNAYSLAVGGPFGPYQYLEAYRKYIIAKGVKNKFVVILLTFPNDLDKAFASSNILKRGGSYRDLFSNSYIHGVIEEKYLPWTVSIYTKLPSFIIQKLNSQPSNKPAKNVNVRFEYGSWTLPTTTFLRPKEANAWPILKDKVGELIDLAHQNGTIPIVVYYPLTPVRILPYVQGIQPLKADLARYYSESVSKIRKFAIDKRAKFLDVTTGLRTAIRTELLFVEPLEYHLNDRGVEVVSDLLQPYFSKKP